MQQSGKNDTIDPVTYEEVDATWREFFGEIDQNILLFLRKMGFSKSLRRLIAKLTAAGEYVPTCDQIRLALVEDLELQTRILEGVYRDFRNAVAKQKVDREHVGGWFNRTTQRKTWKFAIPRARQLMLELQPRTEGTEALANIGTSEWSPDELLVLREFSERYAKVLASLSVRDRQLFDAKIAGKGYEELAATYRTTTGAIKAEVSRLCSKLVKLVRGEDDAEPASMEEREDNKP